MAVPSPRRITLDMLIPGGVLPTDFVHHVTNDGTCSRCRRPIDDDDPDRGIPIMLWIGESGDDMLTYCEACTSEEAFAALAPIAPS